MYYLEKISDLEKSYFIQSCNFNLRQSLKKKSKVFNSTFSIEMSDNLRDESPILACLCRALGQLQVQWTILVMWFRRWDIVKYLLTNKFWKLRLEILMPLLEVLWWENCPKRITIFGLTKLIFQEPVMLKDKLTHFEVFSFSFKGFLWKYYEKFSILGCRNGLAFLLRMLKWISKLVLTSVTDTVLYKQLPSVKFLIGWKA